MKFGGIFNEKMDRRREWHAKFNQGVNGMLLCQKSYYANGLVKVFAALPVLPLFRLREARMRYPIGKAQAH